VLVRVVCSNISAKDRTTFHLFPSDAPTAPALPVPRARKRADSDPASLLSTVASHKRALPLTPYTPFTDGKTDFNTIGRVSNLIIYLCYLCFYLLPVTSLFHQYKSSMIIPAMLRLPWYNHDCTMVRVPWPYLAEPR